MSQNPAAIVGMACRMPGGANTPAALWQLLRDGVDAIEPIPAERWDADAFYSPDPEAPGKTHVRHGGFLRDVDRFDPQFFGIAPKEANLMDPQQRLLLEVAWEALENAGLSPEDLRGSRTAVYIGICGTDYSHAMASRGYENLSGYMASGGALSVAAGRLSYFFGFQGPCMSIDTACSSSLAAVHMAAQSLARGECDLAIAGGVNLVLTPDLTIICSKMNMLAPGDRCRTFDASADGFVRSEGCGVVVLKRQSDAARDGDRILASILGGAINQDGRSGGLTVPNGVAQQSLLRDALADAGVDPRQVTYIETHGTGTPLGDPIEVNAIGAVFGPSHGAANPVYLGAAKASLGHLEGAAGIASLIKTVLVLRHRELPPNIHFRTPNPMIPWANLPVRVPTSATPWSPDSGERIAGVSSFGFSGTNVHIVLREAPAEKAQPTGPERPLQLLPLSAKSEPALRDIAVRFSEYLESSPESLANICHTAAAGRSHFAHRLAVVGASGEEMRGRLAACLAGGEAPGTRCGAVSGSARNKVAFLFTGQGAHYPEMGRRLYESEPVFRRELERCDELLRPEIGESIVAFISGAADHAALEHTAMAQPVLFSLGYALARMWMAWGIRPAAVMGHSMGEYIAACIAGMFSLEDAVKLVAERGRLMQSITRVGRMVAITASPQGVAPFLAPFRASVSISAYNGPDNLVISGPEDEMTGLVSALQEAGIRTQKLHLRTAGHSPLMDPILGALEQAARRASFSPGSLPFISNVTGKAIGPAEILDARYWRVHLRSAVRFESGVRSLLDKGCNAFLEIGPGSTLLGMAGKCVPEGNYLWQPSLRSGRDDWEQVLENVAAFYTRGFPIDWKAFEGGRARSKVDIPGHPFEKKRCWFEEKPTPAPAAKPEEWKNWLYDVQWLPSAETGTIAAGLSKWVILADRGGVGEKLAALLASRGEAAEVLHWPAPLNGLPSCRTVIHLWSLDTAGDLSPERLETAQQLTCETLLRLAQSLGGRTDAKIWAITAGAQRVSGQERLSPAQSLAWGFGRTVGLEFPHLWGGLIDLEPGASPESQAAAILAEMEGAGTEDQVALRNGMRYVPRIGKASETPAPTSFRVDASGTYLITGGMGKLGIKVARWLAGWGVRNLVLTGRREQKDASPEARSAVEALRTAGVRVDALAVDSADAAQMEKLSAHLRGLPRLAGIVAAAGAFSRAPLDSTEFDSLLPTLRAKVAGTWLLGELAREFHPDFFVLFSSITSLLGTQNLAHYAAGCQFQDTFAAVLRSRGQNALAVNWGTWDETGGDPESGKAFRMAGNLPMESGNALAALEYLLASGETQKTVASVDWSILKPLYETRKRKPFLERIAVQSNAPAVESGKAQLRARFEAARPADRPALVAQAVIALVAQVLEVEQTSIAPDENFASLGMDSLMALDLRNSLQTEAGLELPNTLTNDYPTVEALSAYLISRLSAGAPSAEDAAASRIGLASRVVKRTEFPLSLTQDTFAYFYKDNVAFNVPFPYRLKGTPNVSAMEAALAEIVSRSESLRTSFTMRRGVPVQVVSDVSIALSVEEHVPDVTRAVARYSESAFDLSSAPLLKVWLIQAGAADWVLLFVAHHLVFDALSIKVMVREFEALYNAFAAGLPSPLPSPEIQYVDFSEWQLGRTRIDDEIGYWRQQLGAKLPALPFPRPLGAPAVARGEKCRIVLPQALIDRLKQSGRDANQTLFTLMFAAFGVLIHHYSGRDEILMLTAGSGRTMRETENLIGMFAGPLVVRASFTANPTFLDLLARIRESFLGAVAHVFPARRLMESMGIDAEGSSRSLSQVFFDSLPDVPVSLDLNGLESASYFPTERERMRHDLEFYTRPVPNGMYCALWCSRAIFDSSVPQRMMEDYKLLLERIADNPAESIGALLQGIPASLECAEKVEAAAQ